MKPLSKTASDILNIAGTRVEIKRRGRGRPLLVLHGEDGFEFDLPLIDNLAKNFEIVSPRMPGFGKTPLPNSINNMDDISYIWLELMDRLDLQNTTVLGFSVGGWLALEIATKNTSRIARMALTGCVGIKFGGPYDRDIEDIYFHNAQDVRELRFHDPEKDPHLDLSGLNKRQAINLARSREAIAKVCWEPYFHNPSLRHRLHRVDVPVHIIWGGKDGMTAPSYGRSLSKALPRGRFATVPGAGHFPHVEQPDRFAAALADFLTGTKGAR
ncbi:MAG: alpha/beta hydrolase [Pseudomonadota bacterium]|nr:alpha/beta hydrolase [Pseudomonadota bacterium]